MKTRRPRLWFVVPAHGREALTAICLRQLARTCQELDGHGINASAVVIANDRNLRTARELGFATIARRNDFLSAKFNDGIQLALDPKLNPRPADFVVPCGSDDWVDPRILLELPRHDTVKCFRLSAFVDETGAVLVTRTIEYEGGIGVRVYPRELLERSTGFRPADEDRKRGCDTSILTNVTRALRGRGPRIWYGDVHDRQIVDWKTAGVQLNTFHDVTGRFRRGARPRDPFRALAGVFPPDALQEMSVHYGRPALRARAEVAVL